MENKKSTSIDLYQIDLRGGFEKRRRNLLAVDIVIILLAFVNPQIGEINLFGMSFDFTSKQVFVWMGLLFWLIYSIMRARAYFNAFMKEVYFYSNENTYWKGFGQNYWLEVVNKERRNLEYSLRVNKSQKLNCTLPNDIEEILLYNVHRGNIPGKVNIDFYVNVVTSENAEVVSQDVEFKISHHMERYFQKKNLNSRYFLDREKEEFIFWEYKILTIFTIIALIVWLFGLIQLL